MNKYFVPAVLVFAISGLAVTLIVGIVIRSPYTHGNLRTSLADYTRTKVSYVGETYNYPGIPLAHPAQTQTSNAVTDGQLLFFQYGCASCHGFDAKGGPVGPNLSAVSASKVTSKVREGPAGMPQFTSSMLPDADLQKIVAFLQSLHSQ